MPDKTIITLYDVNTGNPRVAVQLTDEGKRAYENQETIEPKHMELILDLKGIAKCNFS
jgi:hypothetical protein